MRVHIREPHVQSIGGLGRVEGNILATGLVGTGEVAGGSGREADGRFAGDLRPPGCERFPALGPPVRIVSGSRASGVTQTEVDADAVAAARRSSRSWAAAANSSGCAARSARREASDWPLPGLSSIGSVSGTTALRLACVALLSAALPLGPTPLPLESTQLPLPPPLPPPSLPQPPALLLMLPPPLSPPLHCLSCRSLLGRFR